MKAQLREAWPPLLFALGLFAYVWFADNHLTSNRDEAPIDPHAAQHAGISPARAAA